MKNDKSHSQLDKTSIITLSAVAIAWAGSFIFIKVGLSEIPPITLAFMRFAIAFPVIGVLTLLTGANKSTQLQLKKDFIPFSILALTGVTILYIFQFYSLKFTTALTGSILINTTVIFMAILSAIFLKEKLSARKMAGITIAFFGLFIVISNFTFDVSAINAQELLGGVLMIVAAISWAVYSIYSKKMLQLYSPMVTTTIVFGLGALYLLPFTLLESSLSVITEITWLGWASLLYLSLICSVFAYVAWNRALSRLETIKVGMFIYFIPVITSVLSYFLLGEEITLATTIGGVLVLIGVYLTETA